MDLQIFLNSLSTQEYSDLKLIFYKKYFNQYRNRLDVPVHQWLDSLDMGQEFGDDFYPSTRLCNVLYSIDAKHSNILVSDITDATFADGRNSGPKSWEEFKHFRGF